MGKPAYAELALHFSQVQPHSDPIMRDENGPATQQDAMKLQARKNSVGGLRDPLPARFETETETHHSHLVTSSSRSFSRSTSLALALSSSSSLSSFTQDSFPASSDSESTDYSSGEEQLEPMCTPKVAKELSEATHSFYAVTDFDQSDDPIPGDEPKTSGMILQGYIDGKPVYYVNAGIHSELKAIETMTAVGLRYVPQPVESCFKVGQTEDNATADDDSGYSSLYGSEAVPIPPNRSFSNDWITVRKSSLGGYGIFATKDIPQFTHFLLERPLIQMRGVNRLGEKYSKLGPEEQLVFDGLHGFDRNSTDPLKKRWNANSFYLHHSEAVFAIASNFNHACHSKRNTQYKWDSYRRVMTFTATSDISKGAEVFISYGEYRDTLFEKFGFICQCGGCEGQLWELPTHFQF